MEWNSLLTNPTTIREVSQHILCSTLHSTYQFTKNSESIPQISTMNKRDNVIVRVYREWVNWLMMVMPQLVDKIAILTMNVQLISNPLIKLLAPSTLNQIKMIVQEEDWNLLTEIASLLPKILTMKSSDLVSPSKVFREMILTRTIKSLIPRC